MNSTTFPSEERLEEAHDVSKRTALKYGADDYEAEEVAQMTVLKLMSPERRKHVRRALDREGEGWKNFASAVAKNLHRDLVRSQERRVARERRASGRFGEPLIDRPAVHRAEPPNDVLDHERYLERLSVAEAIEALESPRQRECMTLVFVLGFSMGEAATELGLKPQTVRGHVRDAKPKVRKYLGD